MRKRKVPEINEISIRGVCRTDREERDTPYKARIRRERLGRGGVKSKWGG